MNGLPKDRTEILNLINEWNSTRLDLFKISEPNEVSNLNNVHSPSSVVSLGAGLLWRDEILLPRCGR